MAQNDGKINGDIEAGGGDRRLYPSMTENPSLRWAFIRKVYSILALQLLVTVAVAAVVVVIRPIPHFLNDNPKGVIVSVFIVLLPFLLLIPLHYYMKWHPVNLILLLLFTIAMAFDVGLSCAFTKGMVILEAAILTCVVVVSLTFYTFWAAKRGHDYAFLVPFIVTSMLILLLFTLIQVFMPMGDLKLTIFGFFFTVFFAGLLIYDTDHLIKRFNYDEHVPAAVCLYLDIVNLFLLMVGCLGGYGSSGNGDGDGGGEV